MIDHIVASVGRRSDYRPATFKYATAVTQHLLQEHPTFTSWDVFTPLGLTDVYIGQHPVTSYCLWRQRGGLLRLA